MEIRKMMGVISQALGSNHETSLLWGENRVVEGEGGGGEGVRLSENQHPATVNGVQNSSSPSPFLSSHGFTFCSAPTMIKKPH